MKKFLYIAICSISVLWSRNAKAISPFDYTPLMSLSPQFCAMCTPAVIDLAYGYIDEAQAYRETLMSYMNITNLKQMALNYGMRFAASGLGALRAGLSPKQKYEEFSSVIQDCKKLKIDMLDEASVKDGFAKLFFEYPSDKKSIRTAYKQRGEQIKMDMALEMYIASTLMAKKLHGDTSKSKKGNTKDKESLGMIAEIEMIESCLVQGKNCEAAGLDSCLATAAQNASGGGNKSAEDETCLWKSALTAIRYYDEIMRYNIHLLALQSQYQAVMGIDKMAKIREHSDEDEEEKKSDLRIPLSQEFVFNEELTFKAMYADEEMGESEAYSEDGAGTYYEEENDDAVYEELDEDLLKELSAYNERLNTKENRLHGNFESLEQAEGFESALDGKEDDLIALENSASIQGFINQALQFHNAKQRLPDYLKIYKNYDEARRYYEKTAQNLAISTNCITQYLQQYYKGSAFAWFGEKCGYYEKDRVYCHYSPEKAANNEDLSDGIFDIDCPDDEQYKCKVENIAGKHMKSGLGGYLLSLYNNAKDQDAMEEVESYITVEEQDSDPNAYSRKVDVKVDEKIGVENSEVFVTPRDSGDYSAPMMSWEDMQKQGKAANSSGAQAMQVRNQEEGDLFAAEARKSSLMNWTLGAEVAKEVEKDLHGDNPKFGKKAKKFPLWNDQKEFYNQYIDGKYANIKEYLQHAPLGDVVCYAAEKINDIFPYEAVKDSAGNITSSASAQKNDAKSGIQQLCSMDKNTDVEISQSLTQEKQALQNLRDKHEQQNQALLAQRKSLYNVLDDLNQQLDEMNKKYNDANEDVSYADQTGIEAETALDEGRKLYAGRSNLPTSPQDEMFKKDIDDSVQLRVEGLGVKQATQTGTLESRIQSAQAQIDSINAEIEKQNSLYIKAYSDFMAEQKKKRYSLIENQYDTDFVNELTSAAQKYTPLGWANGLMECVRKYAIAQVEEAQKQMDALKENEQLYYIENNGKIQKIHTDMIKRMTEISSENLQKFGGCPMLSALNALSGGPDVEKVIAQVLGMFDKICEKDYCITEDDEYFVGLSGKRRDFKAPKHPVDFASAPLREIFHFDLEDYDHIMKYIEDDADLWSNEDITITAESFLNSGLDIPEIWRYILQYPTYVEQDMDFAKLFGTDEDPQETPRGNPNKSFLRSGTYPCMLDGKMIDITEGERGFAYAVGEVSDYKDYGKIQDCQGIYFADGKVIENETEKAPEAVTAVRHRGGPVAQSSELGNILAYIPDKKDSLWLQLHSGLNNTFLLIDKRKLKHKLTFNAALQKAVQALNESDPHENANYFLADKAMLARNQFGDFLNFMELNSIAAQQMAKLEKNMEGIKEDLQDLLNGTEIVLDEDFSLLDEQQYKNVSAALDEQKEIYVNMAVQSIAAMNGITPLIAEKKAKMLHSIEVLRKDADEAVVVTGDEDLAELEEKIKNEQADSGVLGEYEKAGTTEFERQLRTMRAPYCAVYPQ